MQFPATLALLGALAIAPALNAADVRGVRDFTPQAVAAEQEAGGTALGLLRAADLYFKARDFTHAIALYEQAIAGQAITSPLIYSNLSVYYGKNHQYPQAIANADKALAMHPGDLHAQAVKASWLYESGDHEGGLRLFASLSEPPDQLHARLFHACEACFYASVGDRARIGQALTWAVQHNDGFTMEFARLDRVFDPYRGEDWFITLVGKTLE